MTASRPQSPRKGAFFRPFPCDNPVPMSDKNQLLLAIIGTNLAVVACVGMSIGEVRADIQELRADMRENRAIAKADFDKNSAQLAAHLSAHAAPEAPKAE